MDEGKGRDWMRWDGMVWDEWYGMASKERVTATDGGRVQVQEYKCKCKCEADSPGVQSW